MFNKKPKAEKPIVESKNPIQENNEGEIPAVILQGNVLETVMNIIGEMPTKFGQPLTQIFSKNVFTPKMAPENPKE